MVFHKKMEPIRCLGGVLAVAIDDRLVLTEATPVPTTTYTLDFDGFYRSEADRLTRALTLALGDLDLAQEAIDEGMARAFQRWRKISNYDSPAGWVYRVSFNWAQNRIRNRRREVLTTEWTEQSISHDVDPDLQQALDKLAIDARSVVVLRYLLGWSTAETAHALGIRQGTVKSRLARALERLEVLLEDR